MLNFITFLSCINSLTSTKILFLIAIFVVEVINDSSPRCGFFSNYILVMINASSSISVFKTLMPGRRNLGPSILDIIVDNWLI